MSKHNMSLNKAKRIAKQIIDHLYRSDTMQKLSPDIEQKTIINITKIIYKGDKNLDNLSHIKGS